MKILELRFKNLNSLYGEWFIDFSHPHYTNNGIFALIGATGAGKSTILDAICLALYGATPRLGKITKNSNEIMSRGTGECYAEVLFESQAGRFRCHFSQHRSRKKADGELQNPRHEIASGLENGRLIENQLRRVAQVIIDKTGMDFDRFTRSILLAQGRFDAFLKADSEHKSRILEQITGTEIYSQISLHVHERQRHEQEKLKLLQAEISAIVILEPQQEEEIQQQLASSLRQQAELVGQTEETARAISWLKTIQTLKDEIDDIREEATKLQTEVTAFEPQRIKLEQSIQAASIGGNHAMLVTLRGQMAADQASLEENLSALPQLEDAVQSQAEKLQCAEQQVLQVKQQLQSMLPKFKKVRMLDQKITEQEKSLSEAQVKCNREASQIQQYRQTREQEQKKLVKVQALLADTDTYLQEHAQDEWLVRGLAGIEEQLNSLLNCQQQIREQTDDLNKATETLTTSTQKLEQATAAYSLKQQQYLAAQKKLQQERDSLSKLLGDKLLREYRCEKETLLREMALIKKIEELEALRAKLKDGEPCPLCGSLNHPFARGNLPPTDDIELRIATLTEQIDLAEQYEANIKECEQAKMIAQQNLNDAEKLQTRMLNERKTAEQSVQKCRQSLSRLWDNFNHIQQDIDQKLRPLGHTLDFSSPHSVIQLLKSKIETWQTQQRQKQQIENEIAAINSELKRLDAIIEIHSRTLSEKRTQLEQLKNDYTCTRDERQQLYGNKNPDDEEIWMNQAIADAETNEKLAQEQYAKLLQQMNSLKTRIETLQKQIELKLPELEKAEAEFLANLNQKGFSDETQFLNTLLDDKERENLSFRARQLDKVQVELAARQKDREARLKHELEKNITDKTAEVLEQQLKTCEQSLKVLYDTIAGFRHRLSENTKAKEQIEQKQSAIAAQKKEYLRWDKLHMLIGSADGKKYRNFAQGLTFQLMIAHANQQLQEMSDRYLLIHDQKQQLELNVIDNYQGGEIRSIKNLSGGESFIVSLALALGLSKMSSQKVQVDSLFLDEGFGTLDEQALETALETLSGLQQGGKLIGIISHVAALRERIATQIIITPLSGGRSSLSGPGCKKIVS